MSQVLFYADDKGNAPVLDWINTQSVKVQDKCIRAIEILQEKGHHLRRPLADYLRNDIYELRVKHGGNNYRILYFFAQGTAILLSNAFLKKTGKVPDKEIGKAIRHRAKYIGDSVRHTYTQ